MESAADDHCFPTESTHLVQNEFEHWAKLTKKNEATRKKISFYPVLWIRNNFFGSGSHLPYPLSFGFGSYLTRKKVSDPVSNSTLNILSITMATILQVLSWHFKTYLPYQYF
jgi:hypothetical protein